jgi:hypothetical protein
MTDDQRNELFDILMARVPKHAEGYDFLADLTGRDITRIEPAIDRMIVDATLAGLTGR